MKKWVVAILTCALLLSGCSSKVTLLKQTFTIELGNDVYANPRLYIENPDNYDLDEMKISVKTGGIYKKDNRFVTGGMDYLVAGEYDFVLEYGSQSIDFKIKIKDTQPPTVTRAVSEITVAQYTIVNWYDYFSASDISGVSFSTSPLLDTSNTGDYTVLLKISDRFGNADEREVVVHVS